jgi:hypothetical protein
MIEQFFTQPKVLSRLQEGVFGPYLPAFAASLHEEGYSAGCIRRHLRAADHFGAWFTEQRLTVGDLNSVTLERLLGCFSSRHLRTVQLAPVWTQNWLSVRALSDARHVVRRV